MNRSSRLTLHPFIWTNDGPISSPDAPAAVHFVDGMPNNEVVHVVNKRAHGREPLWHIRYVDLDAEIGDYKTDYEALTTLQRFVDDPTALLTELYNAQGEWVDQWGTMPDHFFAKSARRKVEAWERIVAAHFRG